MHITYKLNKDLIGRTAIQLNWNLVKLIGQIYILTQDNRLVNGKSLVGLLSGGFKKNDIIQISLEKEEDLANAKEYFNEIGKQQR